MSPPERRGGRRRPSARAGQDREDRAGGAGGEDPEGGGARALTGDPAVLPPQRYGRYVGVLALLILVLITINTIVTKPNGGSGLAPGTQMPPFAVPLVQGAVIGSADVATRPNEGAAGRVPACQLRIAQVLNLCEHYERGPVVLALFIQGGSCASILSDMQRLLPAFPGVQFLAVSIKGDRARLRKLVAAGGLSFPVGIDEAGSLAALYSLASCPQLTFAYPGGVVQSRALLRRPALSELRARVAALVSASRARGWSPP